MSEQPAIHIPRPSTSEPDRFRFRLTHLFYVTALAAAGAALGGAAGLFAAGAVLALWLFILINLSIIKQRDGVVQAGILVVFAILIYLLAPGDWQNRFGTQSFECAKNLRRIVLALEQYHRRHRSYPPAYIADSHGKRIHSWRAILSRELMNGFEYSFNEPWDGPNNRRAIAQNSPFECRAHGERCCYHVVIGEGTMWPGARERSLENVPDRSNTVLIVERRSARPWTAPDDPTVDEFLAEVRAGAPLPDHPQMRELLTDPGSARAVVNVNEQVILLQRDPTADAWRQLLLVEKEPADDKVILKSFRTTRPNWQTIIPLTGFSALSAWPVIPILRRPRKSLLPSVS